MIGRGWFLVMKIELIVYALIRLVGVGFVIKKKTFQLAQSNR